MAIRRAAPHPPAKPPAPFPQASTVSQPSPKSAPAPATEKAAPGQRVAAPTATAVDVVSTTPIGQLASEKSGGADVRGGSVNRILPTVQKEFARAQKTAGDNLEALWSALSKSTKHLGAKAKAQTHFVGDIEGKADNDLRTLVETKVLKRDPATGALDFAGKNTRLVFGGDLGDRGDDALAMRKALLSLKEKHPDRVTFIWGNRDISKLRIHNDLPAQQQNPPKAFTSFIDQKITAAGLTPNAATRQAFSGVEHHLEFWFGENSARGALECHRKELSRNEGREVSAREAAVDYIESLKPGGEFFRYLSLGTFGHFDGQNIAWHAGASKSSIAVIPGQTERATTLADWAGRYDELAATLWRGVEDALKTGKSVPPMLLDLADGRWDPEARVLYANSQSVVYGERNREDGNYRGVDPATAKFYADSGARTELVAHSPVGSLATPIRTAVDDGTGKLVDVTRVYLDTSMVDGSRSIVATEGDLTLMAGQTPDGTLVFWTLQPDDKSPIGMVTADGFIVRGMTLEGDYSIYKYFNGYSLDEKVVSPEELAAMSPSSTRVEQSEVERKERGNFYAALEAKGKAPIDRESVEAVVGGRRPIVVSAASKYGNVPATDVEVRALWTKTLSTLDPRTDVLITGGTDVVGKDGRKSPEMILHEVAKERGFTVLGFTLEGALPSEINLVDHVVIAGNKGQWSEPLLGALDFAASHGGTAIFIGGGAAVNDGIQAAVSKGVDLLVMKGRGDEPAGASDAFARTLQHGDRRVFHADEDISARLKASRSDGRSPGGVGGAAAVSDRAAGGAIKRVGVFLGSFNPPHIGHKAVVEAMKKQHQLDAVYVVADSSSAYKKMEPLAQREAMVSALFEGAEGIRTLTPQMLANQKSGEMWDVLDVVKQAHPGADLFNIIGSDTLAWWATLPPAQRGDANLTLLVNDRGDGNTIPDAVGSQKVLPLRDDAAVPPGLSSTKIREAMAAGRKPDALPDAVWLHIQQQGLYGQGG